jgi:hypothetical protein
MTRDDAAARLVKMAHSIRQGTDELDALVVVLRSEDGFVDVHKWGDCADKVLKEAR